MGSYLSIVNNTDDPWTCKIGPDEAALKIAGIVVSVIGAIVTVIVLLMLHLHEASDRVTIGGVSVFGVSTTAIAAGTAAAGAVTTAVSVVGTVSDFGMNVANGINDNLINQGYVNINPGEEHKWGKMSLSLWQQGTCVRTTIKDEKTVTTDTLYMRPTLRKSCGRVDHGIVALVCIDTFGLELIHAFSRTRQHIVVVWHHLHLRHHKDGEQNDGQTVYFYVNGSNTYDPNFN
ncbi:hypothetical protein PHPALM_5373 [Phytophthora palmivora]|uniref:Uncharacterized protein n=1 Tax=Phytophthora palmivora TaxID=4796 RepID=A0A2P4YHI2_9STRA|nr:hypothetical protein PHPALM_5373 [Phytophthora palmivora]